MWGWQTEYWLALLVFLYLVFAFSRSSFFWRRGERRYLMIWKDLADRHNLQLSPGSFSPCASIKPLINGKYRKRQVSILADTRGKWNFSSSILKITVSIENKPTDDMPRGAFFVVGDPRKETFLARLLLLFGVKEEAAVDVGKFPMKCVPPNLGNYLLSLKSVRRLLLLPPINDLLITQDFLYYRQVGMVEQADAMRQILDDLCDMAGNFERFVRNWTQ